MLDHLSAHVEINPIFLYIFMFSLNKKLFTVFLILFLTGCANTGSLSLSNKEWVTPYGKFGQTFLKGNFLMEIEYENPQECFTDTNFSINNDLNLKNSVETREISFFCAEYPNKINVPYSGIIRLATSNKIYSAKFPNKEICQILSKELKLKNGSQDIACP
jgi:hypothetical protein